MAATNLRWKDLGDNQRADGINLGWTGCDDSDELDRHFDIGGQFAGAQGVIVSGPIKGMVHVPFASVWSSPAYKPPRFERTVDERREMSVRLTIYSDSEYGWFDNEEKFWNGVSGDVPGYWHIFTRRYGELYLPMQLLDKVENELEDDPTADDNNLMEWDLLLAANGEPRWRQPDLRDEWVNDMTHTTTVRRDEELLAPDITVGVGKLRVANRSTAKDGQWPVFTVTAPGRCWIEDGMSGRMLRIPKLNKGEHVTIDTNPERRIAISATDPADDWTKRTVRNSDLLSLFLREYGEEGLTILERFYGQGFETPIPPRTEAVITVYHDAPGARVSVRLPQRFERAIS